MKRLTLAILGVLALTFVSCQQSAKIFTADRDDIVNIGTIKEADGPVDFTILVPNEAGENVRVMSYAVSCRCVTPTIEPKEVQDGENIEISVNYDPTYMAQKIDEYIILRLSNQQVRKVSIYGDCIQSKHPVKDYCRYDYGEGLMLSHKVLPFGHRAAGSVSSLTINIGNAGPKRAKIDLVPQGPYADAISFRNPGKMKSEDTDTIHVKLTMPSSVDTLCIPVQPYVNGKATETVLKVYAFRD